MRGRRDRKGVETDAELSFDGLHTAGDAQQRDARALDLKTSRLQVAGDEIDCFRRRPELGYELRGAQEMSEIRIPGGVGGLDERVQVILIAQLQRHRQSDGWISAELVRRAQVDGTWLR